MTSSLRDERKRLHDGEASNPLPIKAMDVQPPRTNGTSKLNIDALSDKATAAFIRRTLCAHQALAEGGIAQRPIDELLPPLTSSNEVDLQVYALLAVIVKDFVYTWYAKITPDHVFVDEVIQIVAHCTRALEQRLRKVDLEALLLDEIPLLVDAHLTGMFASPVLIILTRLIVTPSAFRAAHRSFYPSPLASSPREIYHSLNPHPALSPVPRETDPDSVIEQERNEAVWRQLLVQGVLVVLLPSEDLENGCLRALVGEILSELIVRAALSDRICESWMLWEIIIRILEIMRPRSSAAVVAESGARTGSTSRLEQFGLLANVDDRIIDKALKSGIDHRPGSAVSRSTRASVSDVFWAVVQHAFLAFTALRNILLALASSSSLPQRSKTWPVGVLSRADADRQGSNLNPGVSRTLRPLVGVAVWRTSARLIELDLRMPWLAGLFSLLHRTLVGGSGRVDGVLDR